MYQHPDNGSSNWLTLTGTSHQPSTRVVPFTQKYHTDLSTPQHFGAQKPIVFDGIPRVQAVLGLPIPFSNHHDLLEGYTNNRIHCNLNSHPPASWSPPTTKQTTTVSPPISFPSNVYQDVYSDHRISRPPLPTVSSVQPFYNTRDLRGTSSTHIAPIRQDNARKSYCREPRETLARPIISDDAVTLGSALYAPRVLSSPATGIVTSKSSDPVPVKSGGKIASMTSMRKAALEESRLPPTPFIPGKPSLGTRSRRFDQPEKPRSIVQHNVVDLRVNNLKSQGDKSVDSAQTRASLEHEIHETLANLSKMCSAAGIRKEDLLSGNGSLELLKKPISESLPGDDVDDFPSNSCESVSSKSPASVKPVEPLADTKRGTESAHENSGLNQLIEDISATITRKVLDNLRKEFGTRPLDSASDTEDFKRQRASSCLDWRHGGRNRRTEVHTVGSIPANDDVISSNNNMNSRPNIRTCEGTCVNLMVGNAYGKSSSSLHGAHKRQGAWIPPPKQMLYFDESSPLFGKQSDSNDEQDSSGSKHSSGGIQRSQSLSTTITTIPSSKNSIGCYPEDTENNQGPPPIHSNAIHSNGSNFERPYDLRQNKPNTNTEPNSPSNSLIRRRSCESSSTNTSNRTAMSKGNRRDVLYTLRIETFQDNKNSANAKSSPSCLREVEVVRIHRHPDLFVMPDLLTSVECQLVRNNLWGELPLSEPSPVIKVRYGAVKAIDLFPKNNSDDLTENNSVVGRILKRIFTVCRCKANTSAFLQLLEFQPQSLSEIVKCPDDQNFQLVYIFLNDAPEGDETCFGALGLKIKPQEGAALMWAHQGNATAAVQRTSFKETVSVLLCRISRK